MLFSFFWYDQLLRDRERERERDGVTNNILRKYKITCMNSRIFNVFLSPFPTTLKVNLMGEKGVVGNLRYQQIRVLLENKGYTCMFSRIFGVTTNLEQSNIPSKTLKFKLEDKLVDW